MPPQPKHQQAPVRTPARGQRVTPDRRVAVRIGFDVHTTIVPSAPEAVILAAPAPR